MEQVDAIIIMSLKKLGVQFVDDSVTKVQQFDADLIIDAVVHCLIAIDPDLEGRYPNTLPESMSLRFRMCSEIAEAIQNLGFKSEIGYQTLLYPNETDLRRLFVFLVESLPRELSDSSNAAAENVDSLTRLRLQLASNLQKSFQDYWRPHYLTKPKCSAPFSSLPLDKLKETNFTVVSSLIEEHSRSLEKQSRSAVAKATREQYLAKVKEIEQDLKEQEASKLLRAMSNMRVRGLTDEDGDFSDLQKKKVSDVPATEIEEKRMQELAELQSQCNTLTAQYSEALRKIESCVLKSKSASERVEELTSELKEKEAMYKSLKKTYELLPTAQDSIEKLQAFLASADDRMQSLQTQFQSHYDPLVRERDELAEKLKQEETVAQKMERELIEYEEQLKKLQNVNKEKDEAVKLLSNEVKSVDQSRSRQIFTDNIFEIIAQIHKQKLEMDKIKAENNDLMKDVASLSGKLDRAFHVTDELIFKDATKDDIARRSYKLLASLHENCQALLRGIDETSALNREIRELEDQIDLESKKKTVKNLEKIKEDLQKVRSERKANEKAMKQVNKSPVKEISKSDRQEHRSRSPKKVPKAKATEVQDKSSNGASVDPLSS